MLAFGFGQKTDLVPDKRFIKDTASKVYVHNLAWWVVNVGLQAGQMSNLFHDKPLLKECVYKVSPPPQELS